MQKDTNFNAKIFMSKKNFNQFTLFLFYIDIKLYTNWTYYNIFRQDIIQNNIEGIQLEDGAYLILDENGYVGITEIKRSFLASPGVDPNLLPPGWVENQYKWIVWKLASMDRIKLASVILPRYKFWLY